MQDSTYISQLARPRTSPVPAAAVPPVDALGLLEQFGTTVSVLRDHEIHTEGDPATYCYRVVSGAVRTVTLMEDGRRQVGEFLLAGDMFGLDDIGTHDLSAEAVTDTVLRRFPRRMVESLAESQPRLSRRLREMALASLRIAHSRMIALGRKTAVERIASFLLEMDQRMSDRPNTFVELPMNRTDIADHLGLTVETVCRVLTHLKRDGSARVSRTGFEVCNRRALNAMASEARH